MILAERQEMRLLWRVADAIRKVFWESGKVIAQEGVRFWEVVLFWRGEGNECL